MPKSDDSSDFDLNSSVGYAGGVDAANAIADVIGSVDREDVSRSSGLRSSSCHGLTRGT